MSAQLAGPIRIVYFAGPYLEPAARRFIAMLERHPEVDLVLGLCEGEGEGFLHRLRNLWRRRGPLAFAVLALEWLEAATGFLRAPRETLRDRRDALPALGRFVTVRDIHSPEVIARIRALAPDLGVIYGGPLLKPEVFEIPLLGTLGIHHGRAPRYRGKKTTFWEVYNGEATAGVTIQRLNRGIDTGDILRTAEVPIGRKGYGQVWREAQRVGADAYLAAIVDVRRGTATFTPQDPAAPRDPLYRQPAPRDILALTWRRLTGRRATTARDPAAGR
jgi:folate-dependent phosphoribosylglycinamide formyltransferase PurN